MEKLIYNKEFLYEASSATTNYELTIGTEAPFRLASVLVVPAGLSAVTNITFNLKLHKAIQIPKYSGTGLTSITNPFGDSEDEYRFSDKYNGLHEDVAVVNLLTGQTVADDGTTAEFDLGDHINQYVFIEDGDVLEFEFLDDSSVQAPYGADIAVILHGV